MNFTVSAQSEAEKQSGNYIYYIDKGEVVIVDLVESQEIIDVPEIIDNCNVKEINFQNGISDNTRVVKIPKTV